MCKVRFPSIVSDSTFPGSWQDDEWMNCFRKRKARRGYGCSTKKLCQHLWNFSYLGTNRPGQPVKVKPVLKRSYASAAKLDVESLDHEVTFYVGLSEYLVDSVRLPHTSVRAIQYWAAYLTLETRPILVSEVHHYLHISYSYIDA